MKKIILLLILAAWANIAFTQDDSYYNNDEMQTIFTKKGSNGAYGAFSLGYSQIDGKDAFVTGARGAFIINHSLAIGIGGYGFINDLDYDHYGFNNHDNGFSLAGGYGGFFIEPIVAPMRPVHVSFPILIGMGAISLVDNNGGWYDYDPFYNLDTDVFLVIEPAVEVEFNLLKFMRAAASVSYRLTSDIELDDSDIKKDVLNGLNMALVFKFGKF